MTVPEPPENAQKMGQPNPPGDPFANCRSEGSHSWVHKHGPGIPRGIELRECMACPTIEIDASAMLSEALATELRANSLMSAQFRTMQREKEHGWREAEKQEDRADRAEAERDGLRVQIQRVKAMADEWGEVPWNITPVDIYAALAGDTEVDQS